MPIEHVISLEYLTYFIVLHCVLAAFCQLLLNEYCIVLYCIDPIHQTHRQNNPFCCIMSAFV